MSEELIAVFLASSLRLAVPLIFAATGEVVSERAGVLNISLEGIMLSAAFAAAAGSWATGNPAVGLLAGFVVALLLGVAQAFLSVTLQANQIVVGLGLNILALGATTVLSREFLGARSQADIPGFERWSIPGLSELPLVGPAFFRQIALGISLLRSCLSPGGCCAILRSAWPSMRWDPIRARRTGRACRLRRCATAP